MRRLDSKEKQKVENAGFRIIPFKEYVDKNFLVAKKCKDKFIMPDNTVIVGYYLGRLNMYSIEYLKEHGII